MYTGQDEMKLRKKSAENTTVELVLIVEALILHGNKLCSYDFNFFPMGKFVIGIIINEN